MKDGLLEKFIKESEEKFSRGEIDLLSGETENKKLAGFLYELSILKNYISPSKSLLTRILKSQKLQGRPVPVSLSARLQGWGKIISNNLQTVPAVVSVLTVAAVLLVVLLFNPFHKEQSQLADLEKIYQGQRMLDGVEQSFTGNKNASAANNTISQNTLPVKKSATTDPFDLEAVTAESNVAANYPNLSTFTTQEKSANAVDAVLTNF